MNDLTSPSRRQLLGGMTAIGLAASAMSTRASAGPVSITASGPSLPLWPNKAPGSPAKLPTRKVSEMSKDASFHDRWITGVATPTLEVRRPAYQDGSAVVLLPGGGYEFLSWDNEGEEQARWLTERGVTCFILTYRLPGEGWKNRADVPLQDAQRAIRLIRSQASQLGIDPKRISVLGFSAGGHLAGSIATRFNDDIYAPVDAADKLSARPDYAGMVYPVVSLYEPFTHAGSRDALLGKDSSDKLRKAYSVENNVTTNTPPVFLTASSDDGLVPIGNSLAMYRAMLDQQRPAEFHGFDKGGHGFGARLSKDTPASAWPDLFYAYGKRHGIFLA